MGEESHPIQDTHVPNMLSLLLRKASLTECCHAVEAVMSCLTRQSNQERACTPDLLFASVPTCYPPVKVQNVVNVVALSGGGIWARA